MHGCQSVVINAVKHQDATHCCAQELLIMFIVAVVGEMKKLSSKLCLLSNGILSCTQCNLSLKVLMLILCFI